MKNMCVVILMLLFLTPVCGQLMTFTQYPYSDKKDWKNSQAFCRQYHIDLVTIQDDQDDTFFSGYGWFGLYRDNALSPWKWSRGDRMPNFTNWDLDQPNPQGNCVYKHGGKWKTDKCDVDHSFMCYDGLILVKENKTWEEALDYCRSVDGVDTASSYWNYRYDLATLITPKDLATARKTAQEATTDEVWTGMRFLAGKWLWVGGEQMQYKNIPHCPTGGSCGVLEKSGNASFSTRDCQLQRNFLCYKRP